jgi:hypothetical protein
VYHPFPSSLTTRLGLFAARMARVELAADLQTHAFGDLDPHARAMLLERARWGIAVAYILAGRDVPGEPLLGLEALDLLHEVEFEWHLAWRY